jgi:hypothetical protein
VQGFVSFVRVELVWLGRPEGIVGRGHLRRAKTEHAVYQLPETIQAVLEQAVHTENRGKELVDIEAENNPVRGSTASNKRTGSDKCQLSKFYDATGPES